MIRKFKTIDNLAVFQNFEWDKEVCDTDQNSLDFKSINVIYGRNYSGKTTLSRIVRGMETGVLSKNYESPSFSLSLSDGVEVTQNSLTGHGKKFESSMKILFGKTSASLLIRMTASNRSPSSARTTTK